MHHRLIAAAFAASPDVRYVAVVLDGRLELQMRPDLATSAASESDRYEELIVNPTLVTLLTERGKIDCGGFRHALIRYGDFWAFIIPVAGGHVTVSLETATDLNRTPRAVLAALDTVR